MSETIAVGGFSFCAPCCRCQTGGAGVRQACWCDSDDEPVLTSLADYEAWTGDCSEYNSCDPVGLGCYAWHPDLGVSCKQGYVFSFYPPLWAADGSRCLIIHWFDLLIPITPGPGGLGVIFTGTSVQSIRVLNGGYGYRAAPAVTIEEGINEELNNDYYGGPYEPDPATAHAVIDDDPSSPTFSQVVEIIVDTPGSAYSARPIVTIEDPPESFAASATAEIDDGMITAINISAGGLGYLIPPRVRLHGGKASPADPDPIQARAHAVINSDGEVTAIVIDDPGSGYTAAPVVDLPDFPPMSATPIALAIMADDTERTWQWEGAFFSATDISPITGEEYGHDWGTGINGIAEGLLSPVLETVPASGGPVIADTENAYATCHDCSEE